MSDQAIPLTAAQLRAELSRACEMAGGQSAWARLRGVSVSQVSEALSGRRDLSESMVNALGYMRVTRFVPLRGKRNG
jgi:hypothetical protein